MTLDYGQADAETIDGIRVYKGYRPDAGIRIIRFVWPRISKIWGAMQRADADIYYQRTSDSLTGVVAAYCRLRGRRFIFGMGAMADCTRLLPNCPSRRERYLYLYGLYRADRIVAQTECQRRQLRQQFGLDSIVIPSAAPEHRRVDLPDKGDSKAPHILWIGRFCTEKRPEWLLRVAMACPDATFDVIGQDNSSPSRSELVTMMQQQPNIRFLGYIPPTELAAYYHRATALLCTSYREGFPNTFLEAWSHGVPVVTTVDPDGIVSNNKLGICAHTDRELASAIRLFCSRADMRRQYAICSHAYVSSHHALDNVVDHYEALLLSLHDTVRPDTMTIR